MGNRLYYYLANLDKSTSSSNPSPEDIEKSERKRVHTIEEANLISSLCDDELHRPVIDVDEPPVWKSVAEIIDAWRTVFSDGRLAPSLVKVVPSSTPGHFHVYIEHSIRWEAYRDLLVELAHRGVIEQGYCDASLARQATFVRPPHVRKPARAAA